MTELTPRQIVAELDKYIVGQAAAKRAVAVALRSRYRRSRLPPELQNEVMPKNILMIGPTGVGKTEIARRLARLVGAPFVKVEATKYTEVGYVGRDVESMVRDLVETAVRMVKAEKVEAVRERAAKGARERLLDVLVPLPGPEHRTPRNPLEALFGFGGGPATQEQDEDLLRRRREASERRREVAARLDAGELEGEWVEIEVEETGPPVLEVFSGQGLEGMGVNFQELLGGLLPHRRRRRKVTVAEAREILLQQEASRLIDMDRVAAEAVHRAENHGIIFIDEIDKIAGRESGHGPDVSREGVQRDILPIVEGSTVMTKYGPVKTDHILFIAAGAFHVSKPSDLIPELQGRFPIRVELTPLGEADFVRILTEPENSLTRQYQALLAADGVDLRFTEDGIRAIARVAAQVNAESEDIGARRLHTVMERLLEDVAFEAPDGAPAVVVVDRKYVEEKLAGIVAQRDVSRFIL
ncbi:ATP-dependent protease ATPase subunit HslU [Caldinitratiruptor microaerophilus]|uniref:ATP-dependent protease ATPase subunit HslU n=1 Tax=Caldinitratiruptor microaerophilus TaxID=671077 RepID=A0AA35G8K0_9FIRM|nr:ATP-dependent protease ATPase subunit HslU [Caldinitratiruptor microaerophilus]BDG59344.1 ATP-dependent protease ATPase subunit HslU [Caldinitratiruptor microaerophilus]